MTIHCCGKASHALVNAETDMKLVAEASTGVEAIKQFKQHRPDITLMDLQMPDMNGIDATIAIRQEFPDARIIVLTTYTGDMQVVRALKAGARGYLLKAKVNEELLDTIRCVHAGQRRIPPEVAAEVAEYTAKEALSEREIDGAAAGRRPETQIKRSQQALDWRGYGQTACHEHPRQTGRK